MYKFLICIGLLLSSTQPLSSLVFSASAMEEVLPYVEEQSLVLFNVTEVLTDAQNSLGSSPWRRFVRARLSQEQHDQLTFHVFKKVQVKAVDSSTAGIVAELQNKQIPVMAFTSRGRNQWYAYNTPGVDTLTEASLKSISLDFSHGYLPSELSLLNILFAEYYHDGIIYGGNELEKGELLKAILLATDYRPSKVIFVDDKIDSLKGVERALEELDIPFVGVAFNKTSIFRRDFDPLVANLELESLLLNNMSLTDEEAKQLKNTLPADQDVEDHFKMLMSWIDFSSLL